MKKPAQLIMIWLLPLIVIGGLFYPILGYLVAIMMIFLLTLSFFKRGRYWCGNLCPRGSFLDLILQKLSFKKSYPAVFKKVWFRWAVLISLMSFLIFRLSKSQGDPLVIGGIFVSMCLITTIIAIIVGIIYKHRAWCTFCPMGTMQDKIGKLGSACKNNKNCSNT